MASSTKISGSGGSCSLLDVTDWEITIQGEATDVTDSNPSNAGWREMLATGYKGWSGSMSGWYLDGTPTDNVATGAAVAATFTAETGATFAGNIIITSANIVLTIAGGDAVKVSYTFVGDGICTETNA